MDEKLREWSIENLAESVLGVLEEDVNSFESEEEVASKIFDDLLIVVNYYDALLSTGKLLEVFDLLRERYTEEHELLDERLNEMVKFGLFPKDVIEVRNNLD